MLHKIFKGATFMAALCSVISAVGAPMGDHCEFVQQQPTMSRNQSIPLFPTASASPGHKLIVTTSGTIVAKTASPKKPSQLENKRSADEEVKPQSKL